VPGEVGAKGLQWTPYQPDQGQGAVVARRSGHQVPPCWSLCGLFLVENGSPKGILRVLQWVVQGWGQEALSHRHKELADSGFLPVAVDCWGVH